ncbi:MAG: hypothetical protein KDC35_10650 [Acidobacteria bacterium]|nr:hypothetical protein [Acidobacteriota bacterium]
MTEPLTLDQLELLLEDMEPEAIRQQYADALTDDAERMLSIYEGLDHQLKLLTEVVPPPTTAKAKPTIRWQYWILPLAAVAIIGISLWSPVQRQTPNTTFEEHAQVAEKTDATQPEPIAADDLPAPVTIAQEIPSEASAGAKRTTAQKQQQHDSFDLDRTLNKDTLEDETHFASGEAVTEDKEEVMMTETPITGSAREETDLMDSVQAAPEPEAPGNFAAPTTAPIKSEARLADTTDQAPARSQTPAYERTRSMLAAEAEPERAWSEQQWVETLMSLWTRQNADEALQLFTSDALVDWDEKQISAQDWVAKWSQLKLEKWHWNPQLGVIVSVNGETTHHVLELTFTGHQVYHLRARTAPAELQ